jgi:hypothetical protein
MAEADQRFPGIVEEVRGMTRGEYFRNFAPAAFHGHYRRQDT